MCNTALNIEHLKEIRKAKDFESKHFIHIVPHLHDLLLMRQRIATHLDVAPDEESRKNTSEQYSYINNKIKQLLNL